MDAARRWTRDLDALALPERITERAADDPHGFPVQRFLSSARAALERGEPSPSDEAALQALPKDGAVLDVGCGAGAGSLPLATHAAALVGVDEQPGMLVVFERLAGELGVQVGTHAGRWPDIAEAVPAADVAVCHHVLYNVPHLDRFAAALTAHARRRVVVELTAEHPLAWMRPYWRDLHDWDRPPGPTVDDAVAVLAELDLEVFRQRWKRAFSVDPEDPQERLASLGRRLCLTEDREDELRAAVERYGVPGERAVETLWWDAGQG